jgi:ferredoxin
MSAEGKAMFVVLDRDKCTGLGICESISEEHFEIDDDGQLIVLRDEFRDDEQELLEEVVRSCPTGALRIASARE